MATTCKKSAANNVALMALPDILLEPACSYRRCPWSQHCLQDGGDAQVVAVVAVCALRSGVAESCGQTGLIEQPGPFRDEVVEIVKYQYLVVHGEQFGHRGAELCEDARPPARRFEQTRVDPSH